MAGKAYRRPLGPDGRPVSHETARQMRDSRRDGGPATAPAAVPAATALLTLDSPQLLPAIPEAQLPVPVPAKRKGTPGLTWKAHLRPLVPFVWLGLIEGAAFGIRGLHPHWYTGLLWTVMAVAAAGIATLVHVLNRSARHTVLMVLAWAAGSAWLAVAVVWNPAGPHKLMQWGLILVALTVAFPGLFHNRRRPVEEPEEEVPDPRLEKFRARFCTSRPGAGHQHMVNALLYGLEDIDHGFRFCFRLDLANHSTVDDVMGMRKQIAKLFDVPAEQVTIEYLAGHRSEARGRIIILETRNAIDQVRRWDGESTYNPKTGAIQLGWFLDGIPAHWLLHKPKSGAAHGVLAGVTGSGKSHTIHVLAAGAGLATHCADCGPDFRCPVCNPQRINAIWMGDPQRQPFAVWRNRADLVAWGIEPCIELLHFGRDVARERAEEYGNEEWWDEHKGVKRMNKGRGYFDPSPTRPLITIIVDEWPMIVKYSEDTLRAQQAITAAADLGGEARKAGVAIILVTRIPDLTELGERSVREMLKAFNTLCHRTDGLSANMLGIQGDPRHLPEDVHGAGYLASVDRRPSATMRTMELPEYAEPGDDGVDVRELADRIASIPVAYDAPVLRVMERYGWNQPHMVINDEDTIRPRALREKAMEGLTPADIKVLMDPSPATMIQKIAVLTRVGVMEADEEDAQVLADAEAAAENQAHSRRPAAAEQEYTSILKADPSAASLDDPARVLRSLVTMEQGDVYDVMASTNLSYLAASRALDLLKQGGHVTCTDDIYRVAA
jgi:hypothetical protein